MATTHDALYQLAKSANWSPVLEAALPNSSHRPADILLRSAEARPLAIDVTIVHPLRPSDSLAVRVQRSTSAAADAEAQKSARNRQACEGVGWGFSPFGCESTGGLGPAARSLCKRLSRQLAMRAGTDIMGVAENFGVIISVALAKGRGEMLCAATPLPVGS